MVRQIERDHRRFREIVKGKIRDDLKEHISNGEFVGKEGDKKVSVPLPEINIPRFKHGEQQAGGVGQGDGEEGDPLGQGDEQGQEAGEAGEKPGEHALEVDVTLEELAEILGEELELPNIEPKGQKQVLSEKSKYKSISRSGPESLRHFKRTFKEALKRQIALGEYDPDNPQIIPVRDDRRYRARKREEVPQNNALVVYMMDVSGSMGDEQKEMVRNEAFWIDVWLRSQYKKLDFRYIIHDAVAQEVDRETFFHVKESGGTKISSAYLKCREIIRREYDPYQWNIYPFHFSDGDNWGSEDTQKCLQIMRDDLIPVSNQFSYGQVRSAYGSGQFKRDLDEEMGDEELVVTSEIKDREDIYDSIKTFLGKGR